MNDIKAFIMLQKIVTENKILQKNVTFVTDLKRLQFLQINCNS